METKQTQAEQNFKKEKQDFNEQKPTQEHPDLHKVEQLEVLDI